MVVTLWPSQIEGPRFWWKTGEIPQLLIFIAQIKSLDTLNTTQKMAAPCKDPFLKKLQKDCQKNCILYHEMPDTKQKLKKIIWKKF